jgi:hypothetical protein
VAPVATGVADAYKNRFILSLCFTESFLAPSKPVNRVVSVLKKVRALFVNKPVRFNVRV